MAALKDYFAEQGFFWAAVQPQKLSGGRWRYTVTPGEIYRFDRAVVVGANDNWSERFIKDLPLHAGEIFRPSLVRPWLDPLTQPGGGDSQVPYRMRKLTINTDRQKHLVSLVVEVTGRETVKVGEEPSAPGRR